MTICPTCAGKRTIATEVPNVRKYGGVEYVSSVQPTKIRLDVCHACDGTGKTVVLESILKRTLAEQLAISDRAAAVD